MTQTSNRNIVFLFFAVELWDSQRPCPSAPARKTGLGVFVLVGRPIASETGRPGSSPPPPPLFIVSPSQVGRSEWAASRRHGDGVLTASVSRPVQEVAEITPSTVPRGEAEEILVPAGGGIAGVFPPCAPN